MKNFIEPIQGTKIAEFKVSWFKNQGYEFFRYGFRPFYNLGPVILGIFLGIKFIKHSFDPIWLSWLLAIVLFLLAAFWFYATILLSIIHKNYDVRKTKIIDGRIFSLFVVKGGVEINNEFIPYKSWFIEGIESFKLDGDFLIIRTLGEPFISINYCLNENEIKFKIDSKYLNCKEELLNYLNNQIELKNT